MRRRALGITRADLREVRGGFVGGQSRIYRPLYLACVQGTRSTVQNLVEGARDAQGATVEDAGADHVCGHAGVAEELLDGADVGSAFQEVGSNEGRNVLEEVGFSSVLAC